jgi:Poly (ADP-ribose) glycohydrolase (PARG)
MNNISNHLICQHTFDLQTLMDAYPPKFRNANKKIVYRIASPPGCTYSGQLAFSRWRAMPLPETFSSVGSKLELEVRNNHFGYESPQNSIEVEWYLNFAHSDLFCAYGGPLFAQDEMQVAEHPALGSLREALLKAKIEPFTVESGQPTPILIRGVERRCAIATNPDPDRGRPFGLYGNNFAKATPEAIAQATKALDPPTITNIIAMEASAGGYGVYRLEDIEYILTTAFTGFTAARNESQFDSVEQPRVIIHTGFWGCGAYGGNRVLMALLQLLAARFSSIDSLVFHTGNILGTATLARARQIIEQDLLPDESPVETSVLLEKIYAMGFEWGVSDGN